MNIEESPFQFLDAIPKIRVVVRKRPLTKRELSKSEQDIIDTRGTQSLIVREAKQKVDLTKYIEEHCFNFDRAFDQNASNELLYAEAVRPLVDALFSKAKCTCFAYGQTGSGKTFTMMGNSGGEAQSPTPGMYLLAAQDIFSLLELPQHRNMSIFVSFYEIYCTKLHDLLNDRQEVLPLEDSKKNIVIKGLCEKQVLNVHSLMQTITFGNSIRTTGSTSANLDSSRSHAILQIALKEGKKVHGKISFVDLAGSERGADVAETKKQTRMDGAEINKSLLALKECIRALDQDKKHTPFRTSKLTLVLKDSFIGNCKTVMIGNISPSGSACEYTLNTLRYADRVKELKKPGDSNSNPSRPISQADLLAQQLMLPRRQKDTTKIEIKAEDDDDDTNELQTAPVYTNHGVVDFFPKNKSTPFSQNQPPNINNDSLNSNSFHPGQSYNSNPQNFQALNSLFTHQQQQQKPLIAQYSSNDGNHTSHNSLSNQVYDLYTNNKENWGNERHHSPDNQALQQPELAQLQHNPSSGGYNPNNYNSNSGVTACTNQFAYSNTSNNLRLFNHTLPPRQEESDKQQSSMLSFGSKAQSGNGFNSMSQQVQGLDYNTNNYLGNHNSTNPEMSMEQAHHSNFSPTQPMRDISNLTGMQLQQQVDSSSKTSISKNIGNIRQASGYREDMIELEDLSGFRAESQQDLEYLNQRHEQMINRILAEEEEVISAHRRHIDETVELTRQEMLILNEVEKPASDIDDYVVNLEAMLTHKAKVINAILSKVVSLRTHLRDEETISKKFYEQRGEVMDIFDLDQSEKRGNQDDGLLVDDL